MLLEAAWQQSGRVPVPVACPHVPGVSLGSETGAVSPLWCRRSNSCEVCGRWAAFRFKCRALQGDYNHFWTFHTGADYTRESSIELHYRIRLFKDWFQDNIGPIWDWSRVDEVGEQGRHCLHSHALVGTVPGYLPYKKIIRAARRIFKCKRPWRDEIISDRHGAVWYLTKYLGKGLHSKWLRYAHRVYTSLPKIPSKWQPFEPRVFLPIDSIASQFVSERVDVVTGEVTRMYSGPSYMPMHHEPLGAEFFSHGMPVWDARARCSGRSPLEGGKGRVSKDSREARIQMDARVWGPARTRPGRAPFASTEVLSGYPCFWNRQSVEAAPLLSELRQGAVK
jgi:hypothetical protein